MLCHTAGPYTWTSSQQSCLWQEKRLSTAWDERNTHAYSPFHAAFQREVLWPDFERIVPDEDLHAQRQKVGGIHAKQLEHECTLSGTLHYAELNEKLCREDAHVSALSAGSVALLACWQDLAEWPVSFVCTRLPPLLTQMVLASVQNMTVAQALETNCFFTSCNENALGDRMLSELLQDERDLLESE